MYRWPGLVGHFRLTWQPPSSVRRAAFVGHVIIAVLAGENLVLLDDKSTHGATQGGFGGWGMGVGVGQTIG